jgi:hypothetical protein
MMDANRRYVLETQALGSLNSAVAREDSLCSVNHDGPEEAKAIDAFCELSDLPIAVNPWIPRIALQIRNGNPGDRGR